MKLHLIGLFHTVPSLEYSHCAFTGKALRFSKMMQAQGYDVVEYANEGSESEANEKVPILSKEELQKWVKRAKDTDFYGDDAVIGSTLWQNFHKRLKEEIKKRFNPAEDIVCHPFGHAHTELKDFLGGFHVETGIGYPTTFAEFKIFESYAWLHWHQGKDHRNGKNYEWVIPNYFDVDEWEPSSSRGEYILYFGRICTVKGLYTVKEIAKHVDVPVIICGQGDPTPFLGKNVEYRPPISGKARSDLLRKARCILMPTEFTEPFGGAGVEAMLCGTPLISVDYGAFTETVIHGMNGFRCHTLGDWIEAVKQAPSLNRKQISDMARSRYSLGACGRQYAKVFEQMNELRGKGWYSLTGRIY